MHQPTVGDHVVKPTEDSAEQSENSTHDNSRRQFIIGSAGALGGLVAGGALTSSAFADEHDDNGDNGDEEEPPEDMFEDDVDILNYALTLEYLEARFYRQGLDNIGEEGLCNCEALKDDTHLRDIAYDELRTIQEHEESHVETLESTIEDLGGEPIEEPEFDFGMAVEYPMAFLGTAAQLEDIGVSAYAGAAPFIENEDLVAPALGIHSVEARHASFVRTLTDQTGFPDVIDEPRSRDEVLELAGGFIVEEDDDDDDDDNGDDDNGDDDNGDDDNGDDDNGNGNGDGTNGNGDDTNGS